MALRFPGLDFYWHPYQNEMMRFSERMTRLGTETAFEVLAAAKALEAEGRHIVHLEIGEPDFPTSENIVEAAVSALRQGWHHYTPANGILGLREAIAEEVSVTRAISVSPDEVVVTPGAKPIIFFSILALVQPGDEVIYPDPGFPIYESMVRFAGATPVPVALREEFKFRIDVDELIDKLTERSRLIILNSPNNPTGAVLEKSDLERLAAVLSQRDVMVLSDEIYSRILYGGSHASIIAFPGMQERTILLDGFSKTYAMTGWRLGYGVMKPPLAEQVTRLMINSNSCTAGFTQVAGIEALRGDQTPRMVMVERFRKRRDRVVQLLNEIDGISCRTPEGAFYVFPNVKSFSLSSKSIQQRLLNEKGVALLPGTSFGRCGEGYLRISYATSTAVLEEGIQRLAEFAEQFR